MDLLGSNETLASLEARLERLHLLRSRQHQPHPRRTSSCAFPAPFNFSHWRGPDVKMMLPWCEPRTRPPTARSLEELAVDPAIARGQTVAVLPSLIVPCCAHSGTTFLWRCMRYAFHPTVVCGRPDPTRRHVPLYAEREDEWSSSACGRRRYLLPGLAGNIQGHWDYRKEWFFYGGGAAQWQKGWDDYLGVELPLCFWEPEFQRLLRLEPLDNTLAHSRRVCRSYEDKTHRRPRRACLHRTCLPLDLQRVKLGPGYSEQYANHGRPRWQYQATKALPRVDPRQHTGAVVSDMTPNYLCSPKALKNMASAIGTPRHFRLMVLVRDPVSMIRSSYKMFVQWGWVRTGDLNSDVTAQLHALRKCNASLYDAPRLVATLPPAELLEYFGRCWRGTWAQFVTNSFTFVCLASWLAAGFRREQFLVLRSEKLRTMGAHDLLSQVSNFTGLHYNKAVLGEKEEELAAHCEAPDSAYNRARAMQAPLVNSHSSYAGHNAKQRTELSATVLAELERLGSAYADMARVELGYPE